MFKGRSRSKGFTLIELVIVIIILGILAAVAVPKFMDIAGQADSAAAKAQLGSLRSGAVMFFAQSTSTGSPRYPTDQAEMASTQSTGVVPTNKLSVSGNNLITFQSYNPAATDAWIADLVDPASATYGQIWASNNSEW